MAARARVPARLSMAGWRARAVTLVARVRATRVARALTHFGARGGAVLSGGIAYAAVFSVFAALAIAFTVGLAVLGGNVELREAFLEQLAGWLPGLVGPGGVLAPEDVRLTVGPGVAGVVAAGVLVWSASAFMGALGAGVRAMVDETTPRGRHLPGLVRTWAGFLGLGLALLVSTVASVLVTQAAAFAGREAVRVGGALVSFVVDAAMFAFVLLVVAGIRPTRRDLLVGSGLAALAFGVVRYLGVGVVASSSSANPLLAPFAVIVTLLVWINLLARIVLLVTAWVADPKVEIPLPGGNVGGAVRVGDTVRRPTGPWTPAVHALLDHLRLAGLDRVPWVLGTDARGREVLSYLPGTPVDLTVSTPAQLREAAAWVGRFHRAVVGFEPGPRRWRFVERDLRPGEIVCHHDSTIYNMLFDGDRLTGVIDWDVAGPGVPLDDLAILAWSGLPLYPERPDSQVLERLEVLVAGYAEGLASGGGLPSARRRTSAPWYRRIFGSCPGPRVEPVSARDVLEHVVVRMTAATDRIATAQAAGDEGMLNLRAVGEPERTRAQLATYRATRLPALRALLP